MPVHLRRDQWKFEVVSFASAPGVLYQRAHCQRTISGEIFSPPTIQTFNCLTAPLPLPLHSFAVASAAGDSRNCNSSI